jgi:ubiquinone/menaquinone biosynthesis C-methylase UbiE
MSMSSQTNVDRKVARGFGDEWSTFRQDEDSLSLDERRAIFDSYFRIFPWHLLPKESVGLDAGCGSGRWSMLVSPRVGHLHLLDASAAALAVARANLHGFSNLTFHECSVGDIPLPDGSLDFVFSLGVLHHVPDTEGAVRAIAAKLKPGAPFLLYLYYALDNRPAWYRTLWKVSDFFRGVVSRQPHPVRLAVSGLFAALVYWPLARAAALLSAAGVSTAALPLVYYSDKSFYVMRTDAYDRFCTRLEKRFTRAEIERMMRGAGLEQIRFSDSAPYWCAVGIAAPRDA